MGEPSRSDNILVFHSVKKYLFKATYIISQLLFINLTPFHCVLIYLQNFIAIT